MTMTPNRPQVLRSTTAAEFMNLGHRDEFINVIDSLGRLWNPLKHPRDQNGRFIRTFSFVTFDLPGGTTTPGGEGGSVSGRVSGIDKDGNLLVKVSGVGPGAPPGVKEGDYVKIPHDKVQVRTVKAQLGGRGAAGRLNTQEHRSVRTGVANLRRLGMHDEADKLDEARRLAMEAPNPRDPVSRERKQRAIDLFREVGESLGDERGKGFADGTNYDDIKDTLSSDEKTRLQTLDAVLGTTFTARHSLGDKTIDAENDEGPVKAKASEVRLQAAQQELSKDYAEDAQVWDATSGTLVEGHLEQPVKAQVRDTVSEQQGQKVLPELQRSTYQRLKSGLSRLSGYKQAQQVAPGDRFHTDANGDEVVVGSVVHVNPTKSRAGFTGMVSRIYTDKDGKKHVYVRDFDPSGDKGYAKKYKDHSVQGGSIELAGGDEQDSVFQQLALMGASDSAKALVNSFTADYLDKMSRRYASPDAKRISPTGGFFDVAPIHDRVRQDANGEALHIGDSVMGPNGEVGVVTYIDPSANTTKVQYPNGQKAARVSSRKLTRLHGPSSDVYPGGSGHGDNNYVPTREEAASDAEAMGADSVAKTIRDGGDFSAIQSAMVTDVQFQQGLDEVNDLYDRRDRALAAGQEPTDEDRTELAKWDRLAAASAGQFREEPARPPEPPHAPEPEPGAEDPVNPANPAESITEGGVTVREEDGNVIVDDNVEDPIPADDQQAVDTAVQDAEAAQEPGTAQEAPPAPALASKLVNDLGRLVDEAKQGPVTPVQRGQLDKWHGELSDAVEAGDGQGVVNALRGMTQAVNSQVNKRELRGTRLAAVLNGRATDGTPMADFIQQKLDAGENIFNAPEPVSRPDRPAERPDETPEGVDPKVDKVDNAVAEALLSDDKSTLVMQGDQEVNEGFYVPDPATITEYDNMPTTQDVADFVKETQGSDFDGVSVWFDESDGRYRMARVGVFDTEQDASDAAAHSGTNQYVNIADGSVMNVATGGDPNAPTEAVEDPRSEARHVRTAGAGRAAGRTTAKQKQLLDHVAETGGDGEVTRIATAVKNGEEVTGADASRLADAIDAMDAGQFDKPSDKGVASQMAHRLARASGEEGARGYSSQNTALRRTSDVGNLLSGLSQNNDVRALVDGARTDVKNGDTGAAAQKFRDAADAFDGLGQGNDMPSRRAREHADRLDAMGGTTGPAPQQGAPSPEKALTDAGVPEVVPITKATLSNPETERSRPVNAEEFAALALQGKEKLAPRWGNASEPSITSGEVLDALKTEAWDSVQEEWGGMTVDAHHAQIIDPDTGFALTVKQPGMETVTVPIGASQEDFNAGMDEAMQRFGGDENGPLWMEGAHLGIFRNEDTNTYDIDPVLVLDSVEDVEAIGAYTNGVGGAYSYEDGLGYWPPHIAEGGAGGEGQAVPGEVARPGGEGDQAQPGVGPPEAGGSGPGEGPAGGGPEASAVAPEVTDALTSVENAIDDERTAEGDNGPQGMTPALEDAASMLNTIRGKITAEGPYSELQHDLRNLADWIDNHWSLSDPSDTTDGLRSAADALDTAGTAAPQGAPQGGSPGGEGGGGAPFRLRTDDVDGLVRTFGDEQSLNQIGTHLSEFEKSEDERYHALLDQVREGSMANAEVNQARREGRSLMNGASFTWEDAEKMQQGRGVGPEEARRLLAYMGGDEQQILDIMSGQGKSSFEQDSITDFMRARIDASLAKITADADEITADPTAPFDLKMIRAQMAANTEQSTRRRENGMVSNLSEYAQLVIETTSLLPVMDGLRDPANRVGMTLSQQHEVARMARRISVNIAQAKGFYDTLLNQGIDPAPLQGALHDQLAKFKAGDLLSATDELPPQELRTAGNAANSIYRQARQEGKPGDKEVVPVLASLRDILKSQASNPLMHEQLARVADRLVGEQLPINGGQMPDALREIFSDPVFTRYGAFNNVLARMDMEDMVRNGEPSDLRAATHGRFAVVEWEQTNVLAPELTTDDRPPGQTSTTADEVFTETVGHLTPNVASAMSSLFTTVGGGVHRTSTNITEASIPEAEVWRSQSASDWRSSPGSDQRTPEQVGGVYLSGSNTMVVADSSVLDTDYSPVVTHELGHALDSMLGDLVGADSFFSMSDAKFLALQEKIKTIASYGEDPDDSVLHWYFRNVSEQSSEHNGDHGTTEMFAQGLSVYSSAIAEMNGPEAGGTTQDALYWKMGHELTHGGGSRAMERGLPHLKVRGKTREIGKAIFDYYDDLEKTRLPQLMSAPRVTPTRTNPMEFSVTHGDLPLTAPPTQKRATPAQKVKADTHLSSQHGLIQMAPVERGTPAWDQMETAVKQVSPGAGMPSPTAMYVTWNPDFASQGSSVIWKAVMPSNPDKPTTEYTDRHKVTQLAAKFQREQRVNTALDEVHAKAEAESAYDETATLVLAMIETGMRVGSSERAGSIDRKTGKKVPTFGGATMQAKHVFFPSDSLMRFKFPGKAGKENVYESRNPTLRAAVQQLLAGKKPSDQVFANTNSGRSIDYLRTASGIDDIINHDTRTRYATNMARDLVATWPKSRLPKNEAQLKKAQTEIAKKVGVAINDTWTVARDSYISPAVWEPMEDTAKVPHSFDTSPPYGLVEGQVVQSIGGPPVGGTPTPGAPATPAGEAPAAPISAAAAAADSSGPSDPEVDYTLDRSTEGTAERRAWYASYQWPDPPIVAGPDTTFSAEDGDDESPAPTGSSKEE